MKTTSKTLTNTVTVYVSNDGIEFSNKYECMYYEWKQRATKLYAVHERGQKSEATELYFTHIDARKAVGASASHYITEVYINKRFWKEEWEAMNA